MSVINPLIVYSKEIGHYKAYESEPRGPISPEELRLSTEIKDFINDK